MNPTPTTPAKCPICDEPYHSAAKCAQLMKERLEKVAGEKRKLVKASSKRKRDNKKSDKYTTVPLLKEKISKLSSNGEKGSIQPLTLQSKSQILPHESSKGKKQSDNEGKLIEEMKLTRQRKKKSN